VFDVEIRREDRLGLVENGLIQLPLPNRDGADLIAENSKANFLQIKLMRDVRDLADRLLAWLVPLSISLPAPFSISPAPHWPAANRQPAPMRSTPQLSS
jgi:hypothetical protein